MKIEIQEFRLFLNIVILLIFLTTPLFSQQWQFKTIDEGVKPSIAVDSKGIPHIAYMLEATPGFLRYAVLDGDDFTITEIDQAYYYGPLAIAIDANDLPAIALHNHTETDENVYVQTVQGDWVKHRIEDPGHDGWDNSITFDSNNYPHTSSVDPQQFGGNGVEYAWFDGSAWQVENIGSGAIPYEFATSIALDDSDHPHISYFDANNNDLRYASKISGEWVIEVVDTDGGMFSSLVLDENNLPHISYYKREMGDVGSIFYAWFDGNEWNISAVDNLSNLPIAFTGARNVTSLALDENGDYHLTYGDRDVVKYAVLKNGNWEIETVVDVSAADTILGAQTSLALDGEGNPHITWFEATNLGPLQGIVRYASKMTAVSTNNFNAAKSLKINAFPNPAGGEITINYALRGINKGRISIHNLVGNLVHRQELENPSGQVVLEKGFLNPGIYFVILKTETEKVGQKLVVFY